MKKFKGTELSFFFCFLRSMGFHMLFATFWGIWGFLALDRSLSIALFLWALIVGPFIFLTLLCFKRPYTGQGLKKIHYDKYPILTREFFKNLIKVPGPYPIVYTYPSNEIAYAWLEHPIKQKQILIISSALLNSDKKTFIFYWNNIWNEIAQKPREFRWLRSFEWSLWMSNGLPLALCVSILEKTMQILKLDGVPRPSTWLQRWCWSLKYLWFEHLQEGSHEELPMSSTLTAEKLELAAPIVWGNVLWGVWFKVANKGIHPAWKILTHGDAFMPDPV